MELEYFTHCEACDTESQILVMDSNELPQFCAMCGSPVTYESLEEEEDE